ncbi:phosphate ABC transporter substrate-binding protein PstS [Salinibacterium sp. ZJ450]|uniref:phosphate ABC transporter substrate-binding protein PstS n=1 Tax=Salinibacterium sp. ZJ450 TaxID=2708338 RepID=UPI001CD53365|nr:phosphate ABC transporter substrate-binding protein PstS [Salinibacterium sp. ZJ450]
MNARGHLVRALTGMVGATALIAGILLPHPQAAQAAGTTHWPIAGAGSSWSANALEAWMRNVWDNYRWKVTYDNSGSSAGRSLFAAGTVDFGVSEIPYNLKGSDAADPAPPRKLAYMPIVAGGTAFMYNLTIAGKRVTNLRLSGEVITKIFTNKITVWNDPAIAADNPGLALPAIPIVPVVRSEGSGTSAQFSSWMRSQHGGLWSDYCVDVGRGANCGITSNYPVVPGSKFVAQSGSNGVSGYVAQSASVGAITYVEYSYALNSGFPVAKVLNSAGYYAEPTASNVAVALLKARINNDAASPEYLTSDLSGVYTDADPRTYPLSSYSYMLLPTALEYNFTEDKGLTLADFASYFLCEGQQSAESLGYSPLPINLVQAGQEQVQRIPGGNPTIKGISACNNPTFSPDGSNKLANEAPLPQDCDKQGATQCTTGTGGARATSTVASGGAGAGGSSAGGAAATGSEGTTGSASDGQTVVGDETTIDSTLPISVAASPQGLPWGGISTNVLMVTAGALLLAGVLLPPVLSRLRRRELGSVSASQAASARTKGL